MNELSYATQSPILCTPNHAANAIAALACQTGVLRLEVREERCFGSDKWLDVGKIQFDLRLEEDAERFPLAQALCNGQFLWIMPTVDELKGSLDLVIPDLDKQREKAFKVVQEGLQDAARRLGLLLPCFSFDTVNDWPLTRHVTWVMDTSALLQGCADFACQFLFPFVRMVIPPVANLEIQDMCDGFLVRWRHLNEEDNRKENYRVELLAFHLKSQAAQRTLMKLEWRYNAQVERVAIGNDRLRNVFEQDKKSEFKSLGLTSIQRSFADRLIFETAKEHRSHLGHGPLVRIATSDGGMARMALSEGMSPVFFHARRGSQPLGRVLSGTLPHPFKSEIYTISLVDVLWELASCFGTARLRVEDGSSEFRALAMSSVEWTPNQIKEDLFVCSWDIPDLKVPEAIPLAETLLESAESFTSVAPIEETTTAKVPVVSTHQGVSRFIIAANKLFTLAQIITSEGIISQEELSTRVQAKARTLEEYRRFLLSGELIEYENSQWKSTPALETLISAYNSADRTLVRQILEQVPSLRVFVEYAQAEGRHPDWRERFPIQRGITAYRDLAEICGLVLEIPQRGLCATLAQPSVEEFATSALKHYSDLRRGNEWVETGAWLEALSWDEAIAPVVARELLEAAYMAGLLERFFEGSTPDTQFDEHKVLVLEKVEGAPTFRRYFIYRGDFLWSQRSSVRLSLALSKPE